MFINFCTFVCVVKEKWKVLRGCWFEVVGDKWYPFMEPDYAIIEEEHVREEMAGSGKCLK